MAKENLKSDQTPAEELNKGLSPNVLERIPNLVDAVEKNNLKVIPVKNSDGEVTGYDVNSRGGRQLFRVSPEDMTFALLKDTILTAAADNEELTSNFELIEGVQRSLLRLGMSEEDIPRTPHEIAQEAITLMEDFLTIQKKKSEIDIQNNLQGLMAMSMRVYIGGKEEWDKLPKPMQRLVVEIGESLVVRGMEQLGIGQSTVKTAEAMKQISAELSEMRRDAGFGVGFGKALKGIAQGGIDIVGQIGSGIIEGTATAVGKMNEGIQQNKETKLDRDKRKAEDRIEIEKKRKEELGK